MLASEISNDAKYTETFNKEKKSQGRLFRPIQMSFVLFCDDTTKVKLCRQKNQTEAILIRSWVVRQNYMCYFFIKLLWNSSQAECIHDKMFCWIRRESRLARKRVLAILSLKKWERNNWGKYLFSQWCLKAVDERYIALASFHRPLITYSSALLPTLSNLFLNLYSVILIKIFNYFPWIKEANSHPAIYSRRRKPASTPIWINYLEKKKIELKF